MNGFKDTGMQLAEDILS